MAQVFRIIRKTETWDMSVCNRYCEEQTVSLDMLVPGAEFNFFDSILRVLSIDDENMKFSFLDGEYSINRKWQVLGTVSYHIPNPRISKSARYIFLFQNDGSIENWDEKILIGAYSQMYSHYEEQKLWKNIPLIKECLDIMKNHTPLRDEIITPVSRMFICQKIMQEDFVDVMETPFIYQSLCEYWRVCYEDSCKEDYIYEDAEAETGMMDFKLFHKDRYFETVDSFINKLAWLLAPSGNKDISMWESMRTIKYDPVQLTKVWDDNIYDVEMECDLALKDEPAGMGFCHSYWSEKKAALAKRGIAWKSPSVMNPGVMFD